MTVIFSTVFSTILAYSPFIVGDGFAVEKFPPRHPDETLIWHAVAGDTHGTHQMCVHLILST